MVSSATSAGSSCATNTALIAYAGTCRQDLNTDQPLLSYMNFCARAWADTSTTGYNAMVQATVHELTHASMFTRSLYPYWRDASGNPRVTRNATNGGTPVYSYDNTLGYYFPPVTKLVSIMSSASNAVVLATPLVTAAAQKQLGCATLPGGEIESYGKRRTRGRFVLLHSINKRPSAFFALAYCLARGISSARWPTASRLCRRVGHAGVALVVAAV